VKNKSVAGGGGKKIRGEGKKTLGVSVEQAGKGTKKNHRKLGAGKT